MAYVTACGTYVLRVNNKIMQITLFSRTFARTTPLVALLGVLIGVQGCAYTKSEAESELVIVPTPEEQLEADIAEHSLDAEPLDAPEADEPIAEPEFTLWDRIRAGYQLEIPLDKRIDQERDWYGKHQSYLDRVTDRGERYLYYIVGELERRNMPMEFALLPIVESAFDPFAYSHVTASGMWQFMPRTGRSLGLKQNWWYDGRRDVVLSTNAALTYLEKLHKHFDGDWLLAMAAYNSGIGNVSRAIKRNEKAGKPTDFWNLKLPRETQAYVPRLLAISQLIGAPEDYGLTLRPIPNQPYFEAVEVGSQIDLAQAAELAEIDMDELYQLNPAFNRWATDPTGPHTLLVPYASADSFKEKLAGIPPGKRITWDRYTIASGDSLSTIAAKYKVSVDSLKSINGLRNNNIRAGKTLLVPIAAKKDEHYTQSIVQRIQTRQSSGGKSGNSTKVEHIVQSGDSFWSIGKKYGVTPSKVAHWNNLAPADLIKPGQTLVIWTKAEASTASNNAVIRKLSYKVRRGDSLHRIADKFKINVSDILQWNQVDTKSYLQPGDTLTLFVDVTKTN